MAKIICFILAGFVALATTAAAGDLEKLPEADKDYRTKIEAFIKPGGNLKDAVHLLESYRFECERTEGENSGMRCSRSDRQALSSIVRRYQVVIQAQDNKITSVNTLTGLVGP